MKVLLSNRRLSSLELLFIFGTALVPAFFDHPYRINLFLAWEGSYRMMLGQIPYQDFGTPVGYVFWILPALFFKIFGPQVFTLIKAQIFINLISNITFRALLIELRTEPIVRFLTLVVYCLSFSLFNYWPWYNHLVFVVEIIGILFLIKAFDRNGNRKFICVAISAFFIALTFLTKQDTGGLSLLICLALLLYGSLTQKSIHLLLTFLASYFISMVLLVVPFLSYDFSYWFNFGQFPHYSRVNLFDVLSAFMGGSEWIKFYLIIIVIIILSQEDVFSDYFANHKNVLFLLLTLGILGQASVIQVTSYTPVDGNIYFHSFTFAFILSYYRWKSHHYHVTSIILLFTLVFLWWSGVYWNRFLMARVAPLLESSSVKEEVISKESYILKLDTVSSDRSDWIVPDLHTFDHIKLPNETVEGIIKLKSLPIVREKESELSVLNMSELTPLAYELGYTLEIGEDIPLWYHQGVSFFEREVNLYCEKINNIEYDLILFEDIPDLNQFYPYEVRDCIQGSGNYKMIDRFLAPRIPEFAYIEVYVKIK